MKARILLGLILTFITTAWSSNKANAQITGVTVDSFFVYSQSYCSVPGVIQISSSGHITGSSTTTPDSLTIYANYGDGTDTTFKTQLGQNYFWANWQHIYQTTGTYSIMYVVTTSNNIADTLYSNNFTFSNTCAAVSGTLYVDANNNCMIDGTDQELNGPVTLTHTTTSASYLTYAMNGLYAITVPTGTYTVTPSPWWGASLAPSCSGTGSATVTVSTGTTTQDFAYSCSSVPANTDVAVHGWANNWRPGFNRPLHLNVTSNSPCLNIPGTLTLTLDPALSYTSTQGSNPAPSSVSGNVLTWNIANLDAASTFYTNINVYCATTANIGDTFCVTAVITPASADANAANNTKVICAPVNNSMDPNDKTPSPRGIGAAGNIINGQELTYLVNFQNTGNDVAYDVTIADTLDADLNASTFRLLHSSHSVVPTILPGNIVKFRFENINLPDSNSNEPASHGHIIYIVSPKPNLAIGTEIKNTAHIYFDYNSAIVTNTTLNTIHNPQGIQHLSNGELKASVFPNPANNNVYIEVSDKGSFKAELYDMLGRSIKTTNSTNGNSVINVKDVPAGMYLLRLSNAENKVLSTKINVQH